MLDGYKNSYCVPLFFHIFAKSSNISIKILNLISATKDIYINKLDKQ